MIKQKYNAIIKKESENKMKQYIKLNNNENHLSLGNFFNLIKKLSINKTGAIQTEIFCILFNIDSISETTVNNYCTGYRSINNEYKQIYLNYRKKYHTDKSILVNTINNLLQIIDGYIYNFNSTKELNYSNSLKKLCHSLHTLAKNDIYVPKKTKKEIFEYIKKGNYYEALCQILFFIILEKKQPIYSEDEIKETIEEILKNTNLSVLDLKKFLSIQFTEGVSLIPSLKKLAKEKNPYALYELGNLEYNGLITGTPNYENAYNYHKVAATLGHPTSYWMLSHMILTKKIGSLSENDIILSWKYLKKAEELESISAINSIGYCYLLGYTPNKEKNEKLAIKYFEKAANLNYIYAYNNLGKIYEEKKDYQKAFEYYLQSAKEEESWACNKIGEFYRKGLYVKKDLNKAYEYYKIGASSSINNLYPWNIINLVKYFYLNGNSILGIKKDIDLSITLLEKIKNHPYSHELLLYSYYEKFLKDNNEYYLTQTKIYLNKINKNILFNYKYKQEIENTLKEIYSYQIKLPQE